MRTTLFRFAIIAVAETVICGFAGPTCARHTQAHQQRHHLAPAPSYWHCRQQHLSSTCTSIVVPVYSTRKISALFILSPSLAAFCSQQQQPLLLECITVTASVLLLLGYHLHLQWTERTQGKKTWCRVQAETRAQWSQYVRQTSSWLYAVQTLRNAITAQTFLATTVLSLLTLISGKLWEMVRLATHSATAMHGKNHHRIVVQFAAIAMTMLKSAYEFLQSARLMTHAGFIFPVMHDSTQTDNMLRQSEISQWLGLRWLYISLSVIVWTVTGYVGFLVSSLLLVRFFSQIDQAPMCEDGDDATVNNEETK